MFTTTEQRVTNGFELLTRHFSGTTWVDSVDWDILSLADESRCVLGQLFGSYWNGLTALELDEPELYGFYTGKDYASLDTAWGDLIATWSVQQPLMQAVCPFLRERSGQPEGISPQRKHQR